MLQLRNVSEKKMSPTLQKSLEVLHNISSEKNKVQHESNLRIREGLYPEFTKPELLPRLGQELTQEVRKHFDDLIKEGISLSANRTIPKQQIEELRNFVFSHRIFAGSDRDHDRSRLEFEVNKHNIVNEWEKKYGRSWPTYENDVYTNNKLAIKAGKLVSRHHFIPVRSIAIKDTPENNILIEKKIINFKNDRMLEHYPVNAPWNMIPSEAPGDHTDKIHGDNSVFSSIFGPIKSDYHYKQVGESIFISVVPEKFHEKTIPLFVKEYDFFLEKLEEKTGVSIPDRQRQLATDYLLTYAKQYPNNEELTPMDNKEQGGYIYKSLIKPFMPIYDKKNHRELKSFLMKQWEKERGENWPQDKSGKLAQPTFLIQPYSKISSPKWWLYQPDLNSVSKRK